MSTKLPYITDHRKSQEKESPQRFQAQALVWSKSWVQMPPGGLLEQGNGLLKTLNLL